MAYFLEVILTKIVDEEILYKKVELDITNKSENPDELVLLLVQKHSADVIEKNRLISHSTSWRYVSTGSTIIAYIVYSDDFEFSDPASLPISEIKIIESGDPTHPAPKEISLESVVSHGIRHLSFLVTNNPSVYNSTVNPNTLFRFKEIDAALAGKI
ncbi:MAG: hypothetical protein DPW11_00400 [bacterium]|nr:hypothetical protein [Candidatus Microgenomates bacterium CPR3]MCQ3944228.1 hypothetical protein [bacterium]RIK51750.1 MAG: hypothetical protein DCC61_01580 [Candidatus Microgenomates bacterium]